MKVTAELDTRLRQDGRGRVRITIRNRKELQRVPLDIHVKPSQWDQSSRRVKLDVTNRALFSAFNRAITEGIERAQTLALDPRNTVEVIAAALSAPDASTLLIGSACGAVLVDHASRFTYATVLKFRLCAKIVGEVLPKVTLQGVTSADVQRFREAVAPGLHQNTLRHRLRNFRILYHHACSTAGIEPRSIFRGVIPREVPTQERHLSVEDIQRFRAFTTDDKRLAMARDAFLLSMFLGGMRFADVARLKRSQIRGSVLYMVQSKTKTPRPLPIISQAQAIIDAYEGDRVLPMLKEKEGHQAISSANASVNELLKRIAYALGIDPGLSMHWARHSFGQFAHDAGIDLRALQLIYGHKTIKQTVEYMAKFDSLPVGQAFERFSRAMG